MEEEKKNLETKKRNWRKICSRLTLVLAIILLIYVVVDRYVMPELWETKYCKFRQTVTDSPIPREECVLVKVHSPDAELINFNEFLELDVDEVSCGGSVEELGICDTKEELYYAVFRMDNLCEGCGAEGNVCMAYSVEWLPNNDTQQFNAYKGLYELRFGLRDLEDMDELLRVFEECELVEAGLIG